MTTEQLNTALYNKMYAEQEQFKSMLRSSSPEVVMQHSYELVMREDILLSLEENDLTPQQCKALLKQKKPLSELYLAWENGKSNHMQEILSCIENKADELHNLLKARSSRECR